MIRSSLKVLAVNIAIFTALIALLESSARFFIFLKTGKTTAGIRERTQHLNYQPFVMYGPDWDAKVEEFQKNSKPDSCVTLLIGGSTAAGFPNRTLERELSRASGAKVIVFNGAMGGYNSRQQAIVANLWGPSIRPKLIISLDGANDIIHRPRQSKGGTFYLSDTYKEFLSNPLAGPVNSAIIYSQALQGLSRLKARKTFEDKKEYMDLVNTYMNSQRSIDATAKGIESKRLYFLQPFHSFKPHMAHKEAAFTHYDYRKKYGEKYFNIIAEKLQDLSSKTGSPFIDGRNSYNESSDYIFTDDVHLTKKGYELISRQIGNITESYNLLSECSKNIIPRPKRKKTLASD